MKRYRANFTDRPRGAAVYFPRPIDRNAPARSESASTRSGSTARGKWPAWLLDAQPYARGNAEVCAMCNELTVLSCGKKVCKPTGNRQDMLYTAILTANGCPLGKHKNVET